MNDLLIKALKDIIEECPEPKLPYGIRVVEIATKALKDNSSGGYLDALLDATNVINKIIDAWESLSGGCYHRPRAVELWLSHDMLPVINRARKRVKRKIPNNKSI